MRYKITIELEEVLLNPLAIQMLLNEGKVRRKNRPEEAGETPLSKDRPANQ